MRNYDWAGWSEWKPFGVLRRDGFSEVSIGPGVYAIATTKLRIPRVRGVDQMGLVYVGESSRLRGRMWAFYDCIDLGNDNHVGGWRYNLVELKRCAPPRSLVVRWKKARTKRVAVRIQSELLYAYVREHCELPPLNYSLGRELMEKWGWRLFRELA